MANLPNDPLPVPTPSTGSNVDLPSANFPSLRRVSPTELVGPEVANRQHAALEKRTEYLRQYLSRVSVFLNATDETFLRRDGSAAKDGVTGMAAHLPMGAHKIVNLLGGEISATSKEGINGAQLFAMLAALAPADAPDVAYSIVRDPTTGLLTLVGDVAAPSGSHYYGTNAAGVRGYHPLPTAATPPPNAKSLHFPPGISTWVVPSGVTAVWACAAGARGGQGEPGNYGAAPGSGGLGGYVVGRLAVVPGDILSILVGGVGGNGYNGKWAGAGGGGGGGTRVRVDAKANTTTVIAGGGGGGGGGGEGNDSQSGFRGGNAATKGGEGYGDSIGGAAGSGGITEAGGTGGNGGAGHGGAGASGTAGTSSVSAGISVGEDWMFRDSDIDVADGNGDVSLRWYQP